MTNRQTWYNLWGKMYTPLSTSGRLLQPLRCWSCWDHPYQLSIFSEEGMSTQAAGEPLYIPLKNLASFPFKTCTPAKKNIHTGRTSLCIKTTNKQPQHRKTEYKNNPGQTQLKQARMEEFRSLKVAPKVDQSHYGSEWDSLELVRLERRRAISSNRPEKKL